MKIIPVNINPKKRISIPTGSLGLKILRSKALVRKLSFISNSLKKFQLKLIDFFVTKVTLHPNFTPLATSSGF